MKNEVCHECKWELTQFEQSESILKDIPNFNQTKNKYIRRTNRKFSKSGLCRHLNAVHRKNGTENPIHCLKCSKSLKWNEEAFCVKCQKNIDNDLESEMKTMNEEYNEYEQISEEEQEAEEIRQSQEADYNARFRDSRGRNVLTGKLS